MRVNWTTCKEHYEALERQKGSNGLEESPSLPVRSLTPMEADTPPLLPLLKPTSKGSPFLRLPTEIRLQIYSLLVLPHTSTDLLPIFEKASSSSQDYYDYEKQEHGTDRFVIADLKHPTLLMRTIDGMRYGQKYGPDQSRRQHVRSTYSVRADRFRARCMNTTYQCVNNPRIQDKLGILGTNKQIHAEAAELLYSSYTFDFDTHVEAIAPFMSDLTPFSRSCIKSIRFVKRALPYDKEFDRAEWSSAMRYLTSANNNVNLQRLQLGIVAGRPGENGWDLVPKHSPGDFKLLRDTEGMQWLQYVLEIRGLQELDVSTIVEHCPPATNSLAMANYIRFSASVEDGFSQFLRDEMIPV